MSKLRVLQFLPLNLYLSLQVTQCPIKLLLIFWVFALNISTQQVIVNSIALIEKIIALLDLLEWNNINDFQFCFNIDLFLKLDGVSLREVADD